MTGFIVSNLYKQFLDRNGLPIEGGYIRIGNAGSNPSASPIQVYWDYDLTLTAAQPIRTLGGYAVNGSSPANIFVATETVSIEILDENGSRLFYDLNWSVVNGVIDVEGFLRLDGTTEMEAKLIAKSGELTENNLNNCGVVFTSDLDTGLFNPESGSLKIGINGESHIDFSSTEAIQAKRQLRVPSGAPSSGDGSTNAGYSFDDSGDTGYFREGNTGSVGGSVVHRVDGTNCVSISSQQTLSNNSLFVRSLVSGTSWDNSVIIVEHSSGQQPQIGFHAPSSNVAGSLKFYGPTQLFELRNGNDSGFGTWHNKSIASLVGNVNGGNESDLSTNFENRLDYTFTAQEWMSGKLAITSTVTFGKYAGSVNDVIGKIRIYDITAGGILIDGPETSATAWPPFISNTQLSVIFNTTQTLVAGRSYRVELQIRKGNSDASYYPTNMSLNYCIS
jgi:hypothetical protein